MRFAALTLLAFILWAILTLYSSPARSEAVRLAESPLAIQTHQIGFIQFFPDTQVLHAWREVSRAPPGHLSNEKIIHVDLPEQRVLTTAEAQDFHRRLARIHDQASLKFNDVREEQIKESAERGLRFDPIPPILSQSRSDDCRAPSYVENRLQFLRPPPTPSFVARLKIRTCEQFLPMRASGSAFLISPSHAMTAAHVVSTDGKLDPCSYWIVPGANAYGASNTEAEDRPREVQITNPTHAKGQPFGQMPATVQYAPENNIPNHLDDLDSQSFNDHVNSDWALLRVQSELPSASPGLPHQWPLLRFEDAATRGNALVLKTGFPRGNRTRAQRAPGASLSAQALHICQNATGPELFAVSVDTGDSGAPIWTLPKNHSDRLIEIRSLISVGEFLGKIPRAYGPKLSIAMYLKLVEQLAIPYSPPGAAQSSPAKAH